MAQKKGTLALSMLLLNAAILQGCGMPDPSAGFEVSSKFANSLASVSASETDDTTGSTFDDDLRSEPWIPVGDSQTTARIPITPGQLTPPTTTQPTQPPVTQLPVTHPPVTQLPVTQLPSMPVETPIQSGGATPIAGQPGPLSDALNPSLDCAYMLNFLGWRANSLNQTVASSGGVMNINYWEQAPAIGDRTYSDEALAIGFSSLLPRPGAAQNEIRIFGMLIQNSKLSLRIRDAGNSIDVPMSAYSSSYSTYYPSGKPTDEQIRFIESDRQTAVSVKLTRTFYEANLRNASNSVTAELYCNNQMVTSAPLDLTELKTTMRGVLVRVSTSGFNYVIEN